MPANLVFLDTNGWLALLNASDALHVEAKSLWAELLADGSSLVLTSWVVAETGNGLARTSARARFSEAVEMIQESSRARLIAVSDVLFRRALELYSARPDKTWGLVDCASFVIMADEGISRAFTTDRHFEQAGYQPLLPLP